MTTARLFLALWPGPRGRAALHSQRAAWRWDPAAQLVPASQLHLTLHFLGPVPVAHLELLRRGLAVDWRAFELRFGEPRLWRHGLAVLEPVAPPPGLLALHQALGSALSALGLLVEARQFRPHVTLARRAGQSLPPRSVPTMAWRVRSYALVESAAGAYRVLDRYACRGPGGV